jgi:glycosyltransferase involved in cell wall biosynthesis
MRVLQLGPYPPPHGGVQSNLVAIRQFLRNRDISCAVINLTRYRRSDADDVYYPRTSLQVVALLFRLRYDIIHIHFGVNITLRHLALWFAASLIPGKKTVLTFHSGGYPSSEEGRTARPGTLRGFIFRRLDRIICVNEEMVAMFQRFGVPESRIRLIAPHAFVLKPSTEVRPDIAEFFQLHSPVLATVGGLEPEYDVPLQIEVLGDLLPRFPRLGLVIIGAGSLERNIRDLIGSKPYASRMLLCGDVNHAETLRVIQDCNVLLRTTFYDGDSIAVREALHFGTPVVATETALRPAGVHLIAPSDRDACRRTVEQILNGSESASPQWRDEMNDNNLLAVLQLYRELTPSPC